MYSHCTQKLFFRSRINGIFVFASRNMETMISNHEYCSHLFILVCICISTLQSEAQDLAASSVSTDMEVIAISSALSNYLNGKCNVHTTAESPSAAAAATSSSSAWDTIVIVELRHESNLKFLRRGAHGADRRSKGNKVRV